MTSVMWFRRDLRLEDNTAFFNAMKNSNDLVCIFHINPEQLEDKSTLNQSVFFKSVQHLQQELANYQIPLNILYGNIHDSFRELKNKLLKVDGIYFNFDENGFGRTRDQEMAQFLKQELNFDVHPYSDHYLHGAKEIKKNDGSGYKVFTPYYRQWIQLDKRKPTSYSIDSNKFRSEILIDNSKKLLELISDDGLVNQIQVGTNEAKTRLNNFVSQHLKNYQAMRDIPSVDGTSRLSPFLRTGEISIRQVYQEVIKQPDSEGQQTFIQELCWRDFYNMIYTMYPEQKEVSIKTDFQQIEWDNNEEKFLAWKAGQTGFPIVDAAMRQLNKTGWMHNRLRMIVASFLVKDLLIDWRWGEQYFHEKLIDYDPASNIGGWQWSASTGTDSVPYFRIFNPTLQSQRFDKNGDFIRQYVPELQKIDNQKIHEPATLSSAEQTKYQVQIGKDYPRPIVDHKAARKRVLEVYKASKEQHQ